MEYKIYRMIPVSPFHIGVKEGSLEKTMYYIHSDTLFGGICSAYRLLYGRDELESLLEEFKESPPFMISSAFPYVDDIYFLPIPRSINLTKYVDKEYIKRFKKIEFVSKQMLEDFIKNDFSLDVDNILQGKFLVNNEERERLEKNNIKRIWFDKEVPRVSIDRINSSSNIYYFGEIYYNKGCGLYFLVDFIKKDYSNKLEAAIRLLGDEGIGGDRSYGRGLFKLEDDGLSWDLESGFFITLSLYLPMDDEIDMVRDGFYEIERRSGWVYSPEWRGARERFIRMFREGSTFRGNKKIYGDLIKVGAGEYDVYRYGYAFPLYIGDIE